MKLRLSILVAIILFTLNLNVKADSWRDPNWTEMLDSSDVIALVEYRSTDKFSAKAKIQKLYKGKLLKGDEIWISGFSNRYGPIDKMSKGDQYLVFINLSKPTPKGIENENAQLKKDPSIREFVEAYKNEKSYYVWSPTSGDLKVKGNTVQYDLIQTSFHSKQNFYSLDEFETFLTLYVTKKKDADYFKSLLSNLKVSSESDLNSQNLMKLFFLGYNQYDNIFESFLGSKNPSSRYALAQLMGNIKTESSRNILIKLLKDDHSLVQGEAVRQLRNEPAEIVAPILLAHLKTSSEQNFGPSNLMDPVMNRIDGGKAEIIKTLGVLKYKPAIPDLLLLLETDDRHLFGMVIRTLKDIGSRDYIPYINKHLDNKTHNLIFYISMMIANDSLVECLPSFKNFISTCNRNKHPTYKYTISTCCGIGHFSDKSTKSFLLSDYEHFISFRDTLESGKQNEWTKEYIETFTELKIKEARPLIYKSIYSWTGLNEDFGSYPKLFKTKKQLEDSLKSVFDKQLSADGYKLNQSIAFIENPREVAKGIKPKVKYLIEVTIPANDQGDEHQSIVAKRIGLPKECVFIVFRKGWYHLEKENRFDSSSFTYLIDKYLNYVKVFPSNTDLNFFQGVLDNNYVDDDYYRNRIEKAIEEIKTKLN